MPSRQSRLRLHVTLLLQSTPARLQTVVSLFRMVVVDSQAHMRRGGLRPLPAKLMVSRCQRWYIGCCRSLELCGGIQKRSSLKFWMVQYLRGSSMSFARCLPSHMICCSSDAWPWLVLVVCAKELKPRRRHEICCVFGSLGQHLLSLSLSLLKHSNFDEAAKYMAFQPCAPEDDHCH